MHSLLEHVLNTEPSAWHIKSFGHHLQLEPGTHVLALVQSSHWVNVLQAGPLVAAASARSAKKTTRTIADACSSQWYQTKRWA
jgi:hypothetical protein